MALPPLLFHPTTAGEYVAAVLKGGTNAAMAPQVDYFTDVFCPTIRRMGVSEIWPRLALSFTRILCTYVENVTTHMTVRFVLIVEQVIFFVTWIQSSTCQVDALCNIKKRGYFPRGGGEVELLVKPLDSIQPIVMDDRGHVERISIRAFTAGR